MVVSAFVQVGDSGSKVPGYFELQEIDGVNEVALAAVERERNKTAGNRRPDFITPILRPGAPLRFDVWMAYYTPREFWYLMNEGKMDELGEPVWSSGDFDITFALDEANDR